MPRKVKKGELIIEQDKVSKELFFIRKGVVRSYCLMDGEELTRWFALDGDLVASMYSFMHGLPSVNSVVAITDLDLYVAPIEEVKKLVYNSHEWSRWTNEYVLGGLFVLERRHIFLSHGSAMNRYITFQKMRSFRLLRHLPLQHIASYLNMRPQTLSKVRRELASK